MALSTEKSEMFKIIELANLTTYKVTFGGKLRGVRRDKESDDREALPRSPPS